VVQVPAVITVDQALVATMVPLDLVVQVPVVITVDQAPAVTTADQVVGQVQDQDLAHLAVDQPLVVAHHPAVVDLLQAVQLLDLDLVHPVVDQPQVVDLPLAA
jgi:hypothetical protein